jgi:hypothetical protein
LVKISWLQLTHDPPIGAGLLRCSAGRPAEKKVRGATTYFSALQRVYSGAKLRRHARRRMRHHRYHSHQPGRRLHCAGAIVLDGHDSDLRAPRRTVDACGRDAMPPRRRRKWKHLLVGRDGRSHHDASKRACARTKLPTVTLARATARRDAATSDDTCLATDVAACTAEVTDGQQNRSRRSAGWRRSSSR